MSDLVQLLMVRSDDLVILGVDLSGFQIAPPAGPGGPPELVAQSNTARVVLTFPPQAVAEEKYTDLGDTRRRGARLAGPSRIEFKVDAGTRLPLDAQGVLAALTGKAQLVSGSPGEEHTAIELPWRLLISARARSETAAVVSDHAASPVRSPSGVFGLWRARLHAGDASATGTDAGLDLLPLRPVELFDEIELDISPFAPLSAGQRQAIVSESEQALPSLKRLELSPLGGSLSARLIRPNFQWDHDASLGRDQRVRVLAKGVLYPFGHRAEFQVMTERIFDPPEAQSVAGLHRSTFLVVTEPVRGAVEEASLARQFPFSEVEILTRSFTDIRNPDPAHEDPDLPREPWEWQFHLRVPFPTDTLQAELDQLAIDEQALAARVNERLAALPQTLQQMFDLSFGSAPALQEAQQFAAQFDPEGLVQQQRDADVAIDRLQDSFVPETTTGADGETIVNPGAAETNAAIQREIENLLATRPTNQEIQAAFAGRQQADLQVAQLQAAVEREFNDLPRDIARWAQQGDDEANQVIVLGRRIGEIRGRIQAILDAASKREDLFFTPHNNAGQPLLFPLRCAGANGNVHFAVPLLFVRDFHFDGDPDFPEFTSLTDPDVADRLAATWSGSGSVAPPGVRSLAIPGTRGVPLPGVPIDLVRSAQALASDIHEVHELGIAAVRHAGGFRPTITQFKVELPALRTLLPGQVEQTALSFTREFLDAGDRVDTVLRLVDPVKVDFTGRADRSGGLVSPKFAADVISRTLGPVPLAGLPGAILPGGAIPDLSSVYDGATLLGFPLASLIKPDGPQGLPKPPKIVPILESGKPPGVRMEWRDLKLKSLGPFQAKDTTVLDLSVESSPLKSETKCTVADFSLALPPIGPKLLILSFRSVVFIQQAGRAPDLQINGLKVGFDGALKLLSELQEKLQGFLGLGGNKPTVRATSTGITANYTFAVPSVTSGVFIMRNIAMRVGVDVPFDRNPVTVSLGFASRDNPFNLSVLIFGGGGYIDLQIGPTGLTRLEASLEFGASVAIDFFVASGEVHALGGIRFAQDGGSIQLECYLRFGGSVEVLGLVSVSVELVVTLQYDSNHNRLVGHATLVIEIDLTLYADSVELDSGEWVLAGSEPHREQPPAPAPAIPLAALPAEDPGLKAWQEYQEAFAL